MSTDEVLRLRCLACGAIWLKPAVPPEPKASRHCLRCDGELVTDE